MTGRPWEPDNGLRSSHRGRAERCPSILGRPEGDVDVFVIDEIGKMECFSRVFVEAVERLLDGSVHVLATIAMKGGGLIARAKVRPCVDVLHVPAENRHDLPETIANRLPLC